MESVPEFHPQHHHHHHHYDVNGSNSNSSGGGGMVGILPPLTTPGNRFGQLSRNAFFGRHNPHPCRVRHMKGLLDCPVCIVDDPSEESTSNASAFYSQQSRMPVYAVNLGNVHQRLAPDTIGSLQHFTGLRNFSFKEKADPQLGLAPITDNWRQELRALTDAAVASLIARRTVEQQPSPEIQHPATWMKAGGGGGGNAIRPTTSQQLYSQQTGRLIESSGGGRPRTNASSRSRRLVFTPQQQQRPMTSRDVLETRAKPLPPSQSSARNTPGGPGGQGGFDYIFHEYDPEVAVFSMLCGILQTDDTNAVRAWLSTASEREKCLVLDIIQSAMAHKDEYYEFAPKTNLDKIDETKEEEGLEKKQASTSEEHEVNRLVIQHDVQDNKVDNNVDQRLLPNRPLSTAAFRPVSPQKQIISTENQPQPSQTQQQQQKMKHSAKERGIPKPSLWSPESSIVA